ncbi:MAG TPA: hypothetical protein VN933_06040, partial [Candidatus Eremiobacteraceae bacterium]|nr:hypothetical protein [Candidatus Eremiobacteraceae bacterium]
MKKSWLAVLLTLSACACSQQPQQPATPPSDAHVKALADTYLAAYFERNPELITQYGIPGRRQDKLTDNSLDALKAWEAREDAWLAE